jgi:pilus assembly protein CpaE
MTSIGEFHIIDPEHADSAHALITPVPRISLQAFCESSEVSSIINEAISDRRMQKAHVKLHMGGAVAAVEAYREAPTPNVIVIESTLDRKSLLGHLDGLSEYCDAGTKVVIVGKLNDISLYRDLMARGISEYLIAPFGVVDFVRAISELYATPGAQPLGRVISFFGAKGGVGSSTIAHNVGWSISRDFDIATIITDMDLGFGTAGLDFNQDPPQGIADAIYAPERLDSNLVDRLLSKCTEKLNILAAPATLDRMYDFDEAIFDSLLDVLRASVPVVILDIPHIWSAWSRRLLVSSDEVVIVAAPDLGNFRNAKNIFDALRTARPNDAKPKLAMNFVGVPKRPEIPVADFADQLEIPAAAVLNFDPKLFGTAANNGQMIGEVEAGNKMVEVMDDLARAVMGKAEVKKAKRTLFNPILDKLMRKKAS